MSNSSLPTYPTQVRQVPSGFYRSALGLRQGALGRSRGRGCVMDGCACASPPSPIFVYSVYFVVPSLTTRSTRLKTTNYQLIPSKNTSVTPIVGTMPIFGHQRHGAAGFNVSSANDARLLNAARMFSGVRSAVGFIDSSGRASAAASSGFESS